MNDFLLSCLKLSAALLLLLLVCHLWPELAGGILLLMLVLLALAGCVAFGGTLILALAALLGLGVVTGVIAVGVALAPLWLPIVLAVGLIALIRRAARSSA